MFGELPKLFGRNFATSFFLPTVIFISVSIYLINGAGLIPDIYTLLQSNLLVVTTLMGLLSWFFGIGLLIVNRDILRLMEGYGRYNPAKLLLRFQKNRFAEITTELKKINDIQANLQEGEEFPPEKIYRRMDLMLELANRFPDETHWILPTSFGNTVRAFEVYSRVMYGYEAINGWERLLAVIPKDYRELIDAAKAQTDFWVNFGFLNLIFVAEYVCVSIYCRHVVLIWLLLLALGISVIAYNRACSSAAEWGEMVKASFDIFLPELQTKIELSSAGGQENDRAMWTRFSQAILYRLPNVMPKESPKISETQETAPDEAHNNPAS